MNSLAWCIRSSVSSLLSTSLPSYLKFSLAQIVEFFTAGLIAHVVSTPGKSEPHLLFANSCPSFNSQLRWVEQVQEENFWIPKARLGSSLLHAHKSWVFPTKLIVCFGIISPSSHCVDFLDVRNSILSCGGCSN
jgi:hypothetical protein